MQGPEEVGKTNLITRFIKDEFIEARNLKLEGRPTVLLLINHCKFKISFRDDFSNPADMQIPIVPIPSTILMSWTPLTALSSSSPLKIRRPSPAPNSISTSSSMRYSRLPHRRAKRYSSMHAVVVYLGGE
jgi:GTPase SAR1 family protein